MNIALTGALAAWTGRTLADEAMLTTAMNIEAQVLGVPTGVQDYRPALYGGVSAVEMDVSGVHRRALDVDYDDLERRLVLAYTGASRNSGINNWDVMTRRIDGDALVTAAFDAIRDAAVALREALTARDWTGVALALDAEWRARKQLAPGVTTAEIEHLMDRARDAGASAAKICGAGGGGCLICLVEPERKPAVSGTLVESGAVVLPFTLDREGLRLSRA
jgi:D-glycero-alpha-D-manno-heptose-7-phosphate kinase